MPEKGAVKAGRWLLRALPVPAAILFSAALVIGHSEASFKDDTSNGSNWKAGTISIGDSDRDSIDGSVLFDDRIVTPGYHEARCVTLVSKSDVDTRMKMYGVDVTETLISDAMRLKVEKGHDYAENVDSTSCSEFHGEQSLFDGSLSDFGRQTGDYRNGVSQNPDGDYLPSGGRASYRITLHLPESADNSVAGGNAEATFKWEAQR